MELHDFKEKKKAFSAMIPKILDALGHIIAEGNLSRYFNAEIFST